jgi:hypothetical protein
MNGGKAALIAALSTMLAIPVGCAGTDHGPGPAGPVAATDVARAAGRGASDGDAAPTTVGRSGLDPLGPCAEVVEAYAAIVARPLGLLDGDDPADLAALDQQAAQAASRLPDRIRADLARLGAATASYARGLDDLAAAGRGAIGAVDPPPALDAPDTAQVADDLRHYVDTGCPPP